MEREDIIRVLIKEKGMTIKTFSELIDIPYTTLHSMLERGIGKAAVDNVIKVCKALDITIEELEAKAIDKPRESEVKTIAAHAIEDLTKDEQIELISYAQYIKSKRDQSK